MVRSCEAGQASCDRILLRLGVMFGQPPCFGDACADVTGLDGEADRPWTIEVSGV